MIARELTVVRMALVVALAAAASRPASAQAPCPRATLPAYSHNDYEQANPLGDALALGFRGVEADVFLIDGELRVGHDRRAAEAGATFDALYLAPLASVAARCGSITGDARPFLLTIELKEESQAAHDSLVALLGRHRSLLVPSESASGRAWMVEAVLVGWHPPLDQLGDEAGVLFGVQHALVTPDPIALGSLDRSVRLLSLDYGKTMGRWWTTTVKRRRWLDALRVAKAASPGRLLRVHNVPASRGVYAALLAEGVDLIGTKELDASRRLLVADPHPRPNPGATPARHPTPAAPAGNIRIPAAY
jgi:hypothetical protein